MSMIDHRAFAEPEAQKRKCTACRDGTELGFDFTMAYQPIVDLARKRVWGYEALVRGPNGEPAYSVLEKVNDETLYAFDQACRVKAIELAGALIPDDAETKLSINFKPNAVYEPSACIRATLNAARNTGFNRAQLMFEFTEDEQMRDIAHVRKIVEAYKEFGFTTAIDDFGAGHAGLTLLADLLPDLIKIDMALIRDIDASQPRQQIVKSITEMTRALGITCLAEGVETQGEARILHSFGIDLMQGYYFAKPGVGRLPDIDVSLG